MRGAIMAEITQEQREEIAREIAHSEAAFAASAARIETEGGFEQGI